MDFFELDGMRIVSSNKKEMSDHFNNLLISGKQSLIVTFNLDFYRIASENEAFYQLCKNADTLLPDGIGVVNLIKSKYKADVNRITGNDVFEIILELSKENPLSVAFLGSTPSVLTRLIERIQKEYPRIKISAAISPPFLFEKHNTLNEDVIDKLKAAKPDVLFVALGCPRQELWLQENMHSIGAKINVGVGAVFDFYSGNKKRSPIFFQKLSLEWLWRVLNEPVRLSERYLLKDIPFYIRKRFLIKRDNVKR